MNNYGLVSDNHGMLLTTLQVILQRTLHTLRSIGFLGGKFTTQTMLRENAVNSVKCVLCYELEWGDRY